MLTEPPSNGEYLAAAYVVASIILVGYWFRLWRLARNAGKRGGGEAGKWAGGEAGKPGSIG